MISPTIATSGWCESSCASLSFKFVLSIPGRLPWARVSSRKPDSALRPRSVSCLRADLSPSAMDHESRHPQATPWIFGRHAAPDRSKSPEIPTSGIFLCISIRFVLRSVFDNCQVKVLTVTKLEYKLAYVFRVLPISANFLPRLEIARRRTEP